MTRRTLIVALVLSQIAGIVLSAALVATTYHSPGGVEAKLREFAVSRVDRAVAAAVQETSGRLEEGDLPAGFQTLSDALESAAERLDVERAGLTRALIAASQAARCSHECDFWLFAAEAASIAYFERMKQLRVGQTNLAEFASDRYERTVRSLAMDLRRFGIVNLVALSLMLALVCFRRMLGGRFAIFSVAVTAYVAWATYGYVFRQNWTLAIILDDWAAPGHQLAMIAVSLVLSDWLFLRGRITQTVMNAFGSGASC